MVHSVEVSFLGNLAGRMKVENLVGKQTNAHHTHFPPTQQLRCYQTMLIQSQGLIAVMYNPGFNHQKSHPIVFCTDPNTLGGRVQYEYLTEKEIYTQEVHAEKASWHVDHSKTQSI